MGKASKGIRQVTRLSGSVGFLPTKNPSLSQIAGRDGFVLLRPGTCMLILTSYHLLHTGPLPSYCHRSARLSYDSGSTLCTLQSLPSIEEMVPFPSGGDIPDESCRPATSSVVVPPSDAEHGLEQLPLLCQDPHYAPRLGLSLIHI